MLERSEWIRAINRRLAEFTVYVKQSNEMDRTDVNRDAEYFFCKPLNILLGGDFKNLNSEMRNYPAVDLGDPKLGICVQVTSTNNRTKIQKTLDKFFQNQLHKTYHRVIVLIIGEKLSRYNKPFHVERGFSFSMADDIWDSGDLLRRIEELPDGELKEVAAYLKSQIRHDDAPAPAVKKLCLMPPASLGSAFQGRGTELEQLHTLARMREPFFITGLGGMGKTELAIMFGRSWGELEKVHFVKFSDSFRRTVSGPIAQGIENLDLLDPYGKARPEDEVYREALEVLRSCGGDELLIIDNVDREEGTFADLTDDTYEALCSMKMKLLITTRFPVTGAVEAGRLPMEALHKIMRRHDDSLTGAQMDPLIEAVNGHTMMVDLIARTLYDSLGDVEPADILRALRGSTDVEDFPEVGTDRNRQREQMQIHRHMQALFNVVRRPEAEQRALACATLIPEGGMETKQFRACLSPAEKASVLGLCKRGWLRQEGDMLTIHPVIRAVALQELTPGDGDCGDFLTALWGKYDEAAFNARWFGQMAQVYSAAAAHLEDAAGDWADHGRKLLLDLGRAEEALVLCEKVLSIRQNAPEPDRAKIATALNDMGHLYRDLGEYRKCFDYVWQAMEIREQVLSEEDPDLAMSYNNVGTAYHVLGKYQKALIYDLKALELRKRILPEDHLDLAMSYGNVGTTHHTLGDYVQALEYKEKALEIRRRRLPPDHPDLAHSYDSVGTTYNTTGDHKHALEYVQTALEIRQKKLPVDHPDLALSYENAGSVYLALGSYGHALEYLQKALEIRQRKLSPDHPELAFSYDSVGATYHALGDYKPALEYKEKALEIRREKLSPGHPDLALSYDSVGATYHELGDYGQALEHAQKALEIRRKKLPPNHPDLGASCSHVGAAYASLKQYDRAVPLLEEALTILPPHHPAYKEAKELLAHCRQKLERAAWMDQIQ